MSQANPYRSRPVLAARSVTPAPAPSAARQAQERAAQQEQARQAQVRQMQARLAQASKQSVARQVAATQARARIARAAQAQRARPTIKPIPEPPDRRRELNYGCLPNWLRNMPSTVAPSGLPPLPVQLNAVIGTWFEADIIAASVRNCFANGCTKVFIVDNNSPDRTCAEAEAAGAIVAESYATQFYDDDLRLVLMNKVMARETLKAHHPNVWWLSLDADEFPCGPHGETVLAYLQQLDPVYNCLGANAIDLYPTLEPHYLEGRHPADTMPLGTHRRHGKGVFCHSGHWKHPLLQAMGGAYVLGQSRGSHIPFAAVCDGQACVAAREPAEELIIFHAPWRTREASARRLEALCTKQEVLGQQHRSAGDDKATSGNGAIKRWRSLEDVYAGNWDRVEMPHCQQFGRHVIGITLYPWERLLKDKLQAYPRWYADAESATTMARIPLPLV